jgi:UDPglucose 6-dehydrogenase
MREIENVSVIGLGKLGLCIAACLADKGYQVTGVDVDKKKVEEINRGNNPIEETGLTGCKTNLKATNDYSKGLKDSRITFVVVATPTEADGSFSNEQLEEALKEIAKVIKEKDEYHLVVITSTVMPGTTEHVAKFILESISGKKCGIDFGLAYNPEFIALGSVIQDFLNPDFILIGEVNKRDGEILEKMYKKICENDPPIARMSPIDAEIAKISLNCYVTMKITFANFLASLCEQIKSANADVIADAIGMDSRIGRKYLKGGLGYGGPCFPRDNIAFGSFARKVGIKPKLAEMVDEVNRDQVKRIVGIAKSQLDRKSKVSILGLSYKHLSPVIEDSQAIDITESLLRGGYRVSVYDPMALENAQSVFGDKVDYADSVEDCLKESELCIITTRWEEFKALDEKTLKKNMKKAVVLDCWRLIEKNDLKGVKYIALGRGRKEE